MRRDSRQNHCTDSERPRIPPLPDLDLLCALADLQAFFSVGDRAYLVMIGERPRIASAQDRGAWKSSPTYILCMLPDLDLLCALADLQASFCSRGPRIRGHACGATGGAARGRRDSLAPGRTHARIFLQHGISAMILPACKSQVLGRQVLASSVSKFSKSQVSASLGKSRQDLDRQV